MRKKSAVVRINYHMLKSCRERTGLSYTQFCKAVGTSYLTAKGWESGVGVPSATELYIISRLYNKPMEDFIMLVDLSEGDTIEE